MKNGVSCSYDESAWLALRPAVAAGIASEQWTIETLIERTAGYNPPIQWEQFIESLPNR
jgi:hypothetical protein